MRIIAVGSTQSADAPDSASTPSMLPRVEARLFPPSSTSAPSTEPEHATEASSAAEIAEVAAAPPVEVSAPVQPEPDAEELSDADVAPDSSDELAAAAAEERAAASAPQTSRAPPPLRRAPPPLERPKVEKKPEEAVAKPKRKPWWEDLFGEDFSRANLRLTDRQVAAEVDFIEHELGVSAGGIVLDLGCGGGHHAVELASRGYGVVGYDLSLFQLSLAADFAQERGQKINFLQGDMREMAFEDMFDGVFCWNTSFGYFEEEKNVMVAQRVFRALRPGGNFLVDVANRDYVGANTPSQLWFEGDACVCMDDASVDYITSRLRVKRSLILDDGRTKECNYSIRLYSMHELGKLLHSVGFRITEASGHASIPGVFFGQCSPRVLLLAQKPEA